MQAPGGHSAFHDINEALPFARVVPVVVDAEEVPEFVKNRFLPIANSEGEELEVRPVRFAAHDSTAVRVDETFPVLPRGIDSLVRDRPVDPPVRSHGQTGYVVSTLSDVDGIPPAEQSPLGGFSVLAEVLVLPDVGLDRGIGRALGPQNPSGDAGQGSREVVVDQDALVCLAVSVRILDTEDFFLLYG